MTRHPTILIHADQPEPYLRPLAAAHPDLLVHTCDTYGGVAAALERSRAEVVFTVRFAGTPNFPRRALLECGHVKWISVGGSGTDHLSPWDPNAITVTNAAGIGAGMMAEYAIGAMLFFALRLNRFKRYQKDRKWRPEPLTRLAGKTVVVLGLGHTGQAVAERAQALGLRTIGLRANPRPTPHVHEVQETARLVDAARRADFMVVCVPLTHLTRGLVGETVFAVLPKQAILIDVSRGGVVDHDALMRALDENRIGGAAVDVFATEPLPDSHPLWAYDNVILTPHCSSVYDGWQGDAARMFSENVARYRECAPLDNVVDPHLGY